METLFENKDLRLSLTGHDYDFVGTIEILSDKSMSFFFSEELYPEVDDDGTEYDEYKVAEDETELVDVAYGLTEEEAEEQASLYCDGNVTSATYSKEDDWTGFLSSCQQRGWFLALVKHYCPERLKDIAWA